MHVRTALFLGSILITTCVLAQQDRSVASSILVNPGDTVQLQADPAYQIDLQTCRNCDAASVRMDTGGEYSEAYFLSSAIVGRTVSFKLVQNFDWAEPQDKLSAHKVHSVSLQLIVPEQTKVIIESIDADVLMQGSNLQASVNLTGSGSIMSTLSYSTLYLDSVRGDIQVTQNFIEVEASSQYGFVTNTVEYSGPNLVRAHSLSGNITISPN